MSFLHPQLLWLLLAPAALLAFALRPARSTPAAYPKIPHARLGPSSFVVGHWSFAPRPLAASLALALLVTALARPQGGEISTPAVVRARDVLVAVDVSRSMLADDVAPSRLERARLLVRSLADKLQGERLGLLPFAGTAFLQSPLSVDYGIFRTFLDELGPDMIPAGGSDFTALLTVADEAFGPAPSSPDAPPSSDRYLIILSDGEAQDDTWRPVAQKLANRGVRIITLGLGTAAGTMIPDGQGSFVKDPRGAVVLSRLDASTLRELARLTDGTYRDASAWIDLPALLRETIAQGRASESIEENSVRRAELFAWFLAPALALLILSLVREFPVTLRPRALKLARAALLAFGLGAVFLAAPNPALAAEPAPDPLLDLVSRLSTQDALPAPDLATLATLSAERGEADPALPKGVLRDALAAVNIGEKTSPKTTDWPALRQRLETLLNPPPPPEQQQQPKPNDQSPPPDEKPGEENQDSPSSSQSDSQSDSQSASPSDSSDSKPGDESSGSPREPGNSPSDASSTPPKPSSQALGDLNNNEPKPDPASDSDSAPSDASEPTSAASEPTQRAGGVSASGQPRDASASSAATDPALAIPQQRLDQIRDADSPARLFQRIQDSELTPEDRERAASGRTRDW